MKEVTGVSWFDQEQLAQKVVRVNIICAEKFKKSDIELSDPEKNH
ncbi:MAG: hypothetical protein R3C61_04715 [Bacteroidia bacterium]